MDTIIFSENLRNARKAASMTQEDLAEVLGVSRQAVAKWESGSGYPETEKLIALSQALDVSLDALMGNDRKSPVIDEKLTDKKDITVIKTDGRIFIKAYDGSIHSCLSVQCSDVLAPMKGTPAFNLIGVDHAGLLGSHTVILGFYEFREDRDKELAAIMEAIRNGETDYELKYNSPVEISGILGAAKLIKDKKE